MQIMEEGTVVALEERVVDGEHQKGKIVQELRKSSQNYKIRSCDLWHDQRRQKETNGSEEVEGGGEHMSLPNVPITSAMNY